MFAISCAIVPSAITVLEATTMLHSFLSNMRSGACRALEFAGRLVAPVVATCAAVLALAVSALHAAPGGCLPMPALLQQVQAALWEGRAPALVPVGHLSHLGLGAGFHAMLDGGCAPGRALEGLKGSACGRAGRVHPCNGVTPPEPQRSMGDGAGTPARLPLVPSVGVVAGALRAFCDMGVLAAATGAKSGAARAFAPAANPGAIGAGPPVAAVARPGSASGANAASSAADALEAAACGRCVPGAASATSSAAGAAEPTDADVKSAAGSPKASHTAMGSAASSPEPWQSSGRVRGDAGDAPPAQTALPPELVRVSPGCAAADVAALYSRILSFAWI